MKDNCFTEFCCFCQTSTWISHTYIPSLWKLPSLSPSHPSRLIQSPCLSFLSHTANSHWLSILYMVSSNFNVNCVNYPIRCSFHFFFLMEQGMAWNSGKYNMNFGGQIPLTRCSGWICYWASLRLSVLICKVSQYLWSHGGVTINDTSKGKELSTWPIRTLSEEKQFYSFEIEGKGAGHNL